MSPSSGSTGRRTALVAAAAGGLAGLALATVGFLTLGRHPAAGSTATVATPAASPAPTAGASGPSSSAPAAATKHHTKDQGTAPGWEVTAIAGRTAVPDSAPVSCPAPVVRVGSAAELRDALSRAHPGDVIGLRDGTYTGHFVATASGTASQPIFVCGGPGAVLDGGGADSGYVFHLDHVRDWRLVGFTVRDGQKGVVADATVASVIQGLTVTGTGDEAIHLRDASTDNVVAGNTVSDTGLHSRKFGEGIYVGSARSNWCKITSCQPDRSDRNIIRGNSISRTSAENVDVKEGTTGGQILDNSFDGTGMSGADSWVDVKGDAWLIAGNRGVHAPKDGFQTHRILDGWGDRNVFRSNHADVGAGGAGFALTPPLDNVVACDNTASNAGAGLSNVSCR